MQVIDNREAFFLFQLVHEALLRGKKLDPGSAGMVAKAEVAFVSFLCIGHEPDRMDLHGRDIPEKTTAADWSVIDHESIFFGTNFTAFGTSGAFSVLHFSLQAFHPDVTLRSWARFDVFERSRSIAVSSQFGNFGQCTQSFQTFWGNASFGC